MRLEPLFPVQELRDAASITISLVRTDLVKLSSPRIRRSIVKVVIRLEAIPIKDQDTNQSKIKTFQCSLTNT